MVNLHDCQKQSALDTTGISIWGRISIAVGFMGTLFIANFFLAIIPNNLQGQQLHMASKIGFAGIAFGLIGLIRRKDKLSLIGVIYSFILIIFPVAFWVIGTFIEALINTL
jgi:hypothetical protein